jgi:hypothetical protein
VIDQYFGTKELYEVVLRAKVPMRFGPRMLEEGEPVLYFENISMSVLNEKSSPIMARGGWANLPHVIWEDRSEVQFVLSEGVMSSISMGILLSANVVSKGKDDALLISKREGPFTIDEDRRIFLEHWPAPLEKRKTFIYEYERDVAQKKIYGKRIYGLADPFEPEKERPCIELYSDRELKEKADITK